MIFRDRTHAGKELAELLTKYKDSRPVVVGLPRGGVVTAAEVARAISAPLDIVVPRKIGAPENPEYALGAVTEDGEVFLENNTQRAYAISQDYLREEIEKQIREAKRRVALFRGGRKPLDVRDRDAIIVDDGIATGATMFAAIHSIQQKKPKKIIVAVPVAAADSLRKIQEVADAVVVVHRPLFFASVGEFYEEFPQTSDEEVIRILQSFAKFFSSGL